MHLKLIHHYDGRRERIIIPIIMTDSTLSGAAAVPCFKFHVLVRFQDERAAVDVMPHVATDVHAAIHQTPILGGDYWGSELKWEYACTWIAFPSLRDHRQAGISRSNQRLPRVRDSLNPRGRSALESRKYSPRKPNTCAKTLYNSAGKSV